MKQLVLDQCKAHFWGGATRCDLENGHEGNHEHHGFAQWDEQLAHYPTIREELF